MAPKLHVMSANKRGQTQTMKSPLRHHLRDETSITPKRVEQQTNSCRSYCIYIALKFQELIHLLFQWKTWWSKKYSADTIASAELGKLRNVLLPKLVKVLENLIMNTHKFLNSLKNDLAVVECNDVEGIGLPKLAFSMFLAICEFGSK